MSMPPLNYAITAALFKTCFSALGFKQATKAFNMQPQKGRLVVRSRMIAHVLDE